MDALVSKMGDVSLEPQKMYLTWKTYNETVGVLALKVYRSGWEPNAIVSIGRGGTPVGDALSRLFHKTLGVIMASSYDEDGNKGKLNIAEHLSIIVKQLKGRVLLVDDLADTGETQPAVKRYLQEQNPSVEIRTAAVYLKTCSKFIPDYSGQTVGEEWIYFPYEIFEKLSLKGISPESLQDMSDKELLEVSKKLFEGEGVFKV